MAGTLIASWNLRIRTKFYGWNGMRWKVVGLGDFVELSQHASIRLSSSGLLSKGEINFHLV